MKYQSTITTIVAALLGLLFLVFGLNFFLHFLPNPPAAPDSPATAFINAMYGSGYLAFVKVIEITGGLALAIPRFRRLGLLLLGPVIVNIVAYHVFLMNGAGLTSPPIILIGLCAFYLLWAERRAFASFLKP